MKRLLGSWFWSGNSSHLILQPGAAHDEQDPGNQEHQRSSGSQPSIPEMTKNECAKGKNDIDRTQAKAENRQITLHAVHSLNLSSCRMELPKSEKKASQKLSEAAERRQTAPAPPRSRHIREGSQRLS